MLDPGMFHKKTLNCEKKENSNSFNLDYEKCNEFF